MTTTSDDAGDEAEVSSSAGTLSVAAVQATQRGQP
jgi:hypothetical protein